MKGKVCPKTAFGKLSSSDNELSQAQPSLLLVKDQHCNKEYTPYPSLLNDLSSKLLPQLNGNLTINSSNNSSDDNPSSSPLNSIAQPGNVTPQELLSPISPTEELDPPFHGSPIIPALFDSLSPTNSHLNPLVTIQTLTLFFPSKYPNKTPLLYLLTLVSPCLALAP